MAPRIHVSLEANASAEFDLPIAADELCLRRAQHDPETGGKAHGQTHWIQPLVMVENISEHTLKFQANAFRYP